jgi:hypothetical protein
MDNDMKPDQVGTILSNLDEQGYYCCLESPLAALETADSIKWWFSLSRKRLNQPSLELACSKEDTLILAITAGIAAIGKEWTDFL